METINVDKDVINHITLPGGLFIAVIAVVVIAVVVVIIAIINSDFFIPQFYNYSFCLSIFYLKIPIKRI